MNQVIYFNVLASNRLWYCFPYSYNLILYREEQSDFVQQDSVQSFNEQLTQNPSPNPDKIKSGAQKDVKVISLSSAKSDSEIESVQEIIHKPQLIYKKSNEISEF